MAFGGVFNPNYAMLPNQQGQNPQPQQPSVPFTGQSSPMSMPANRPLGMGDYLDYAPFGNSFFSMPYSGGYPGYPQPMVGAPPPSGYTKPGTTQPTMPPPPAPTPTMPAPSVGSRPVTSPTTPPSVGSRPVGTTPPPPAAQPVPPPIAPANSAQESGQNWMNQYNSPEYAAWYNSLAPSTRAFAHAPGSASTGQYLYDQGVSQYNSFGNNVPWVPNR